VKRSVPASSRSSGSTFVIDTDRTVLDVIHSEFSMGSHADKALALLKARPAA
jgi:peroxiredoxin Q/BCP